MSNVNLFIDDIRLPEDVRSDLGGYKRFDWLVARDYTQAVDYIIKFHPQRIAFDHDLGYGNEKTGKDIANTLIQLDMNHPEDGFITEKFEFSSHSWNTVGRVNIEEILDNYMRKKFQRTGRYKSEAMA